MRYLIVDDRYDVAENAISQKYPLAFEDSKARIKVYENPGAFPRAYVSPALAPVSDHVLDPPWAREVAVTDDAKLLDHARASGVSESPPASFDVNATIVDDENTRVVIETESEQPGVLVLADSYHPNWHATVDGQPAELGRVNGAFRGVVVPAGSSTVEITYDSSARRLGAAISMLSIVLLFVATIVLTVRDRRRRAGDPEVVAADSALRGVDDSEVAEVS